MFDFDEMEKVGSDEGLEENDTDESGEKKKKVEGDDAEGWEIEEDLEDEENM